MPEAIGLVAGLEDMAVMREPIEQRGRQLGIDNYIAPFGEDQVGRDDHTRVLIEFRQQKKRQRIT